jgi:hypothetical protein
MGGGRWFYAGKALHLFYVASHVARVEGTRQQGSATIRWQLPFSYAIATNQLSKNITKSRPKLPKNTRMNELRNPNINTPV